MTTKKPEQSRKQRKPGRGKTDTSKLKISLVVGSVLATLVGGEMLANQESVVQAEPVSAPVVIQQADGTDWVVSNGPIVELVIPDPVTRSRTSG